MGARDEQNRAFLDAIRESPDDDVPRLVYADWLDDHGDGPRADFIRVQCELARLPPGDARRARLEGRESELLRANREAWLGPLRQALMYNHCTFRRGFPDGLTTRPSAMVKLAEEFEARVPAGRVTLAAPFGDPMMKALVACPRLGWVVGLKYDFPTVKQAGLVLIAESANLPNLVELSVRHARYTADAVRALAISPHRGALRRLDLNYPFSPDPAVAEALAESGMRFRLRSLGLLGHAIGPDGAAALAGTKNLAEVKELDLIVTRLDDEGAVALARSRHLRGLSLLELQTNDLTSRSVCELAGSPLLKGIRELNLQNNDVGDEGAEALAASPRLASIERLNLRKAKLTDRAAEALAASRRLSNLTHLDLMENRLTDGASQALFESPHLRRLEEISMCGPNGRTALSRRQRKQWKDRLGKGAQV